MYMTFACTYCTDEFTDHWKKASAYSTSDYKSDWYSYEAYTSCSDLYHSSDLLACCSDSLKKAVFLHFRYHIQVEDVIDDKVT